MQQHHFIKVKQRSKKRVGRGGKRGSFSGHGVKGQKSRAGAKIRPAWRDLIKQIPKKRGYSFKSGQDKIAVVNLGTINNFFKEGDKITKQSLLDKKLIGRIKGKTPEVKILGDGEINKKLSFKGFRISVNATEKIKAAGGTII